MRKILLVIVLLVLAGCGPNQQKLVSYKYSAKVNQTHINAPALIISMGLSAVPTPIYGYSNKSYSDALNQAMSECRKSGGQSANCNEDTSYVGIPPAVAVTEKESIDSFKSKCTEIGFVLKTKEHANCVLELAKMQSNSSTQLLTNQALADEMKAQRNQQTYDELIGLGQELSKGRSLSEIYGGAPPKSGSTGGSCTLTNSVQSGTNRICYYRCGVSTQTSNVGAAQQCPLTM
jgi:hypothetical protein